MPSSLPGFLSPPSPCTLVTLKGPPGPPDMPCLTSPIWASVHAVLCSEGSCQRPAYGLDLVHKCVLFGLHIIFLLNLSQHFKKKKKNLAWNSWLLAPLGKWKVWPYRVRWDSRWQSDASERQLSFCIEACTRLWLYRKKKPGSIQLPAWFLWVESETSAGRSHTKDKKTEVWPSKAYYLIRETDKYKCWTN